MNDFLSANYWNERYQTNQTGWDLGGVSPAIQQYIDEGNIPKDSVVLIPGAGRAYEAKYMLDNGYTNIHVIDFAPELIAQLRVELPTTALQLHCVDFFEHEGQYDFIIEQTFFCAIDPIKRNDYAQKMKSLLTPTGKLVGLLFNRAFEGGPPFGGSANEYNALFQKWFNHVQISPCMNSHPARQGSEVWITVTND